MTADPASIEEMRRIVEQRGGEALRRAQAEILSKFTGNDAVSEALRHFANVTLRNALPVFPTLISLSCEAAGGSTANVPSIGAAIILIAGAADVHDDIIDESLSKGAKRTVFGKCGKDVALLAGDILLIQGLTLLQKECEALSKAKREKIFQLVAQASFEISKAEALDSQMKRRLDLPPQEYFEVIRLKASVPELTMKIGAILGNGDAETVASLGRFGYTYGVVSLVAEEFIDLMEYREFMNRLRNECPPLPVLYALLNEELRNIILPLLRTKRLPKEDFQEITKSVLEFQEVQQLKYQMHTLVEDCLSQMDAAAYSEQANREISALLRAISGSILCAVN